MPSVPSTPIRARHLSPHPYRQWSPQPSDSEEFGTPAARLTPAEEEVVEKARKLAAARVQVQEQARELETCRSAIWQLQREFTDERRQVARQHRQIKEFEALVNKAYAQADQQQAQHGAQRTILQQSLANQIAEVERLKADQSQEEGQGLQEHRTNLESQLEEATARVKKLQNDKERLLQQIEEERAQYQQDLSKVKTELEEERQRHSAQLEEERTRFQREMEQELAEYNSVLGHIHAEIADEHYKQREYEEACSRHEHYLEEIAKAAENQTKLELVEELSVQQRAVELIEDELLQKRCRDAQKLIEEQKRQQEKVKEEIAARGSMLEQIRSSLTDESREQVQKLMTARSNPAKEELLAKAVASNGVLVDERKEGNDTRPELDSVHQQPSEDTEKQVQVNALQAEIMDKQNQVNDLRETFAELNKALEVAEGTHTQVKSELAEANFELSRMANLSKSKDGPLTLEECRMMRHEIAVLQHAKLSAERRSTELEVEKMNWQNRAASLEKEIFESKEVEFQNQELLVSIQQCSQDCELLEAENCNLRNGYLKVEHVPDQKVAQWVACGHNNHQQKIKYVLKLKEENKELYTELRKAKRKIVQLEMQREGDAGTGAPTSTSPLSGGRTPVRVRACASEERQSNATRTSPQVSPCKPTSFVLSPMRALRKSEAKPIR